MTIRVLCCLVVCCVFAPDAWADEAKKGKRFALVVGVRDYDHDSLKSLDYTENDADGLARLLTDGGFDEVVLLTSTRGKKDDKSKPTAANLRAQLKRLLDKVKRDDMVVVALAGHGLQLRVEDPRTKKEKEESFFCPADAKPKRSSDLAELSKTMIPLTWLFGELEDSGAGVKLMLVDACRDDPKLGRNMDTDSLPRPPRGTAALFSCKGGERAFETAKLKHGVFFHYVIEGLSGKAKNRRGEVTWSSLVDYVVENVSEEVPKVIGEGARQTPQELKNLVGRSPVLLGEIKVKAGPADAVYRKGVAHLYGIGAVVDQEAAETHFREAAGKGHKLAAAHLAWGMLTDHDIDRTTALKKVKETLPDVRRAAEEGDADARVLLASINLAVTPRDKAQALKGYRALAEKNDARGMVGLGDLYNEGRGVEADQRKALEWYRKAAELGYQQGQVRLSWRYQSGRGVDKDARKAAEWMKKAADQGHAFALYSYGRMLAKGDGVDRDEAAALEFIRKAAGKNHVAALARLVWMYRTGSGVKKDESEAKRWSDKVASLPPALRCGRPRNCTRRRRFRKSWPWSGSTEPPRKGTHSRCSTWG